MPPSLKLGCLERQSALWWRSSSLPSLSRLSSGSLCLGGRGTPLTPPPPLCPESALCQERSLPFRRCASAHPPPTTVWGARGRLFPHRRPRRWVDLKQPHRRVFTDFLGGRARPFKCFCPPLTRYPHSDLPHPPSRFWCAENSHLQSILGWQSGDTSGFLPLLHGSPSPAACVIGDTFGFLPQPMSPVPATLQSMNKDAKDFPSWWTKSHEVCM